MNNKKLYQEITKTIIEMLETQLEKWDMPWIIIDSNGESAHNGINHTYYNSINKMLLSFMSYIHVYTWNAWLTFNQISKSGEKVLKGCKSVPVYFWSILYYENNNLIHVDIIKKDV